VFFMKECSGQAVGGTDSKEQAGHGESDKRCGGGPEIIAPTRGDEAERSPDEP
jgi:hypothetical protein